jgi:hypothetical protein
MSGFQTNRNLVWCADGVCRYKGSEIVDRKYLQDKFVSHNELKREMNKAVEMVQDQFVSRKNLNEIMDKMLVTKQDMVEYTDFIMNIMNNKGNERAVPRPRFIKELEQVAKITQEVRSRREMQGLVPLVPISEQIPGLVKARPAPPIPVPLSEQIQVPVFRGG